MTISESSIRKSASALVELFGDEAPAQARARMDEYPQGVAKDGYRFWLAVADAASRELEQERARSAGRSAGESAGVFASLRARLLREHE